MEKVKIGKCVNIPTILQIMKLDNENVYICLNVNYFNFKLNINEESLDFVDNELRFYNNDFVEYEMCSIKGEDIKFIRVEEIHFYSEVDEQLVKNVKEIIKILVGGVYE